MNLQRKKLLLLDDSLDIGLLVKQSLKAQEVVQCVDIAAAKNFLSYEKVDMIIIDVHLPDGSGFDYCIELSSDPVFAAVPKILLTGRADISDKVYGLNCGAMDYVTKPFSPLELQARVDIHLRSQPAVPAVVEARIGGLDFDVEFQRCFRLNAGQRENLGLTPTEFRLLFLLAKNEGHVLSRQELENAIWKSTGVQIEKRGIDSHVAHIRSKLGSSNHLLVSVYGKGYSFRKKSPGN